MATTDVVAPPSGEQYPIAAGGVTAIVTEVGATLRGLAADGAEVLDGFDVSARASAGRGQVLAPWPNRLEDGRYEFEGRAGRAALDEPEHGNAIHGLVRWVPWTLTGRRERALTLRTVIHPQPAYPWRLALSVGYEVSERGLTVLAEATNMSDAAAPFGIGFHPYFTAGTPRVDDAVLTVPAATVLLVDGRALPTGRRPVETGDGDFRAARRVGDARLDTAFTDLDRDADGLARVRLERAHGSRPITVWMDGSFRYVQIYTGDTLEPVDRRRRGIAIEPMTCPPNALRTGEDLIRLAPGASWGASWGIEL